MFKPKYKDKLLEKAESNLADAKSSMLAYAQEALRTRAILDYQIDRIDLLDKLIKEMKDQENGQDKQTNNISIINSSDAKPVRAE